MIFEPWVFKFPCARSIGFHVVTQGEAYLRLCQDSETVRLTKGDVVLLARGYDHELATVPSFRAEEIQGRKAYRADDPNRGPLLTIVSGLYQFWNEPIHPLFRELPDYVLIHAESVAVHDPIQTALRLLSFEVAQPDLATESVTRALLDILFSYIIRNLVKELAFQPQSWCQTVLDPELSLVLQVMHADWARNWSLEELAQQGRMSRASLAHKFKRSMGDTPLHYLTTIRIQHAMELLSNSGLTVEQVALAVGYSDAFGFSKTFKRFTGASPRDFRQRFLSEERERSPS